MAESIIYVSISFKDLTKVHRCGAGAPSLKYQYSPITVCSPVKADLVAVYSAFPRLVRGRSGRIGETVILIVLWYDNW